MMRYQKKPIVIEAFRWTGGPDQTEDPAWIVDALIHCKARVMDGGTDNAIMILSTLNGNVTVHSGEWIVKGVKGELYPCRPDIFEATYKPVNESAECTDEQLLTDQTGMTVDERNNM